MLDTDTKRRIDTARDILVGKVPDPKSQVEQITIALIYKFMDDMDAEAEELGGKRKFFAGEFARYGWAKLLQKGLGGHEALALYSDGISRMPENPGVPALFRDIFKNAYLPYRDPETLKAFLKIIDEFKYDHSERLGDAFEYLLSVLGSQGDAGQFRTPRHIIDFLVQVINPQKNETILDPACGTAGFLISAWKHIQAQNQSNGHSTLTPDERGRLARNIKGYDISPDMVRLSLANLYLHGFTDPHVVEYDTLTSEERWNEHADVILANPPFMSPKGGIKPHKRFSVQSKRSEVLFVDYMAEHLTPNGRAGIIVPEGIIFQSQGSYKELRKMLVENSLVAVISLPAGVFQPYSGVKTSILVLDRSIAKQSDSVAFFKVENDGFGLGVQRRPIDKDDLPRVRAEIAEYLRRLRARVSLEGFVPATGQIVSKDIIAENGEYNLSGERYRESAANQTKFEHIRLGDVCLVNPKKSEVSELPADFRVSFVPMADLNENRISFVARDERPIAEVLSGYTYFRDGDVLVAKVTPCFENGKAGIAQALSNGIGFGSSEYYVLRPKASVLPEWIYFCIRHPSFREPAISKMTGAGGLQRVPRDFVEDFEIPLPPLDVQKEIVAEIQGYQKVIDGARQVVDNYRPHVAIDPDWPMVELGEICRFIDYRGKTPEKHSSGIPLITAKNVREGFINPEPREFIAEQEYDSWMTRGIPQVGDVLFTMEAPLGNAAEITMTERFALAQRLVALCPNRELMIGSFLKDLLLSESVQSKIQAHQSGTTVYGIKASVLKTLTVPVPPLDIQQSIVTEIEAEQALVDANKELIARFEKKIQAVLDRVWGSSQSAGEAT